MIPSSHIHRPFSIGQSEQGTELIGIRISRGVRSPRWSSSFITKYNQTWAKPDPEQITGPWIKDFNRFQDFYLKIYFVRESLKPMVRLSGNIHGNEAIGREISLAFARSRLHQLSIIGICLTSFAFCRHLILGYGVDQRLTQMIDCKSRQLKIQY